MEQAVDKVFTPDLEYVTLFSGADNAAFRELYLRANKKVGLSVAVPSIDERADILRHIRLEKCTNVNLFEATDFTMMKAAITSPQDLIVLMPKSSSFDLIRLYPDYLLHFKQSSLDELIRVQKESLQEFSKFLVTDGLLLYMVDTMNKKESVDVIQDFLSKNKDFELVEHRQYYPFEKEDSTFYYAILKKVDHNND
jgi:16S rRNA C967 or C1407 C5-methylase (RsmB/RsmF family)